MSNKKAAAIAEILEVRDQLVVMRERLFQLTAAKCRFPDPLCPCHSNST